MHRPLRARLASFALRGCDDEHKLTSHSLPRRLEQGSGAVGAGGRRGQQQEEEREEMNDGKSVESESQGGERAVDGR